jgi:Tol biopolymer transport system component
MTNRTLRLLLNRVMPAPRPARPPRTTRTTGRLAVEQLEDRCLPSTIQAFSLPPPDQTPPVTAAGASINPSVSDDGNFVAFESDAPNLVPGQTGGYHRNVFLLDRSTGATTLVSHVAGLANETTAPSQADAWSPILSGDGRYVFYETWASEVVDGLSAFGFPKPNVVLYDRLLHRTTLVSHSNTSLLQASDLDSNPEAISTDGRFLVFMSTSTNVVPGQQEGPVQNPDAPDWQYFLYDRLNPAATRLITHSTAGPNVTSNGYAAGNVTTVADDGTVAYVTEANNIVPGGMNWEVYLYTPDGNNQRISAINGGSRAVISRDGLTVAFAGDNGVWRLDRRTGTRTLLTEGADGISGGSYGWGLAVSKNGRFITFASDATNLVPEQFGPAGNLFLYDAQHAGLKLVSGYHGGEIVIGNTAFGGVVAQDAATMPGVSDNGLVAYVCTAPDAINGQTNTGPAGTRNVFLYTGPNRPTTLVSGAYGSATAAGDANSSAPFLAAGGSLLAFQSQAGNLLGAGLLDGNGVNDVFTFLPAASAGTLVSAAAFQPPPTPGTSFTASVNDDGRFSVFTSTATNLVPNQVNPHSSATVNVFLYDRVWNTVRLVNHVPGLPNTSGDGGLNYHGEPADQRPDPSLRPVISDDGSFVAFVSYDNNLVAGEDQFQANLPPWLLTNHLCVYLYETQTGEVRLVNHAPGAPAAIDLQASSPAVSRDGRYVVYLSFDDGAFAEASLRMWDRVLDTTTTIAFLAPGAAPHAVLSGDGRFVAYEDNGDVYVYDSYFDETTLVSHNSDSPTTPANGISTDPVISTDGSAIAFVSGASDVVAGQVPGFFTNVFVYQNDGSGVVRLVSGVNGSATVGGDGNSDSPAIDGDGSSIAYRSDATDLIGTPVFGSNIYQYRVGVGQTLISARAGSSTTGAGGAAEPVTDDDGHLVSYVSTAGDLVAGQSGLPGVQNVYLWLRQTGANILASGQDGSPILTGNADSDAPLLPRAHVATASSFPVFSSRATNLVHGVGGNSVAYINTLVQLKLSSNVILDGSQAGSLVGVLNVASLLAGQYLPPVYRLATDSKTSFDLAGGAGGTGLVTRFLASYAARASYVVTVHFDIGLGDTTALLMVYVAAPGSRLLSPTPTPGHTLSARLIPVKVGKRKKTTRLMVKLWYADTGEEKETFAAPFQGPAFRKVQMHVRDTNGDGTPDQVVFTAVRRKKKVTATFPA